MADGPRTGDGTSGEVKERAREEIKDLTLRVTTGKTAARTAGKWPGGVTPSNVLRNLPPDELVEVHHPVFHRGLIGAVLLAAVHQ